MAASTATGVLGIAPDVCAAAAGPQVGAIEQSSCGIGTGVMANATDVRAAATGPQVGATDASRLPSLVGTGVMGTDADACAHHWSVNRPKMPS